MPLSILISFSIVNVSHNDTMENVNYPSNIVSVVGKMKDNTTTPSSKANKDAETNASTSIKDEISSCIIFKADVLCMIECNAWK